MKYRLLVAPIVLLVAIFIPRHALAAEGSGIPTHPGVLCLPGVYLNDPGNCTPAGPSAYLSAMARQGFTFPLEPLPAHSPAPSLTYLDWRYGEVTRRNAPVYSSIEDAMDANKRQAAQRIDSPFSYISYTYEEVVDGKRFYMVAPGAWMTANDVSRLSTVPLFQGLAFSRTPRHSFGWVLTYLSPEPVRTKNSPGYDKDDYTEHVLQNHQVVQVYDVVTVGDQEWYMVGPGEWIPQDVLARVVPDATPPNGVPGDRWIEVNLFEQTLTVYDNRELVFATLIASGLEPFWTRPGLFQIYEKHESTPMRGSFEADRSDAYYLEDVPWTMYYDQARALHGAYWRANLGFPQSHGCVNLSVGDSRWLFDWADVGDWVYVWDPSGKTPEDPDLYTPGGA
jgi:lipoprotein-anchoring transpeptidase ErfK/SrfK